jgi:hypothetical protein
MIAREAYCRYEKRGGTGGELTADWLEVEAEIEKQISEICKPEPTGPGSAVYRRMRSEMRRIVAGLEEKASAGATGDPFGWITRKTKKAGQAARREVGATSERLGRKARNWIKNRHAGGK